MKNLLPIAIVILIISSLAYIVISKSQKRSDLAPDIGEFQMEMEKNMDGTPVKEVTAVLITQNNSGESGVATLKEKDGKITVDLKMEGAPTGVSQPAHIHTGSCEKIGGVKHPLASVVVGTSSVTLDTTFEELKKDLPLAINVHKSATEAGVYVACGNLFSE